MLRVERKLNESKIKNNLQGIKKEINLMIAHNKVFTVAVSMTIQQELEYKNILDAYSIKTNGSWLPLARAVAVRNRVDEEDVKRIYAADPLALRRKGSPWLFTTSHALCEKLSPSIISKISCIKQIKGV